MTLTFSNFLEVIILQHLLSYWHNFLLFNRFIEKYWVLQKQNPDQKMVDIFNATREALEMEGEKLKTFEEIRMVS